MLRRHLTALALTAPLVLGAAPAHAQKATPGTEILVLAPEVDWRGTPDSWWAAVIVAIRGETYTLRWRDFPQQPLVKRPRHLIGIMYPAPLRP